MTDASPPPRTVLPSIDRLMRSAALASHAAEFGRALVVECARTEIAELRQRLSAGGDAAADASEAGLVARIGARLQAATRASLVAVGRALLQDPEWVRKIRDGRFDELSPYDRASIAKLY